MNEEQLKEVLNKREALDKKIAHYLKQKILVKQRGEKTEITDTSQKQNTMPNL